MKWRLLKYRNCQLFMTSAFAYFLTLYQSIPVFLPGEFNGQRSLAAYSPRCRRKSDTNDATDHVCTHSRFKSSCPYPRTSQVALVVKNLSANAGDIRDMGSTPGLGRSPGGGHANPFQYSCLEDPHGHRSLVGYRP